MIHFSPNKRDTPDDEDKFQSPSYPGVNSLKRIRVSPPKPGQLYPQVAESSSESNDESRPVSAMSMESAAPSEAPSLGAAIKRAANNYK